ncbi:MAG: phosphatase PAP2 family protein, partial [Chitinophagales bacterium]|nr:phosphatase PAP2 family protein [Chitinophagales bacterium]
KTMINEYFEKGWEPYVETPSFPGYTSGHSGFSGAAATVLTSLIGDNKSFIDSSHMDVGLLPRTMKSFNEAAEEAAFSRMYGGIHYTCEILDGLEQGKCAANEILNNVIINAKRQDVTGKKKDTEMSKSEDEESAM